MTRPPRASVAVRERSRRLPVFKLYRSALVHHAGEVQRVPVSEANATMRLGFANLVRFRCAMNAVGGRGEVNPDQADGIVRPRLDDQWLIGFLRPSTRTSDRNDNRDCRRRVGP